MRTRHVKPRNVKLGLFDVSCGALYGLPEMIKTEAWRVTEEISIEQAKAKGALVPSHLTLG